MKGIVHSYESLAAVDGKGVRFAVFLAGCPLRCVYCHNPDTWQMVGREIDAEELVKKAVRYKPYFAEEGGVTFSGGEPLIQSRFLQKVIPLLKREGISSVVDTSGGVELTESVKEVLSLCEEVLLDLKFYDDETYLSHTGMDMSRTRKVLDYLESIGKNTRIRTVVVPGINDREDVMDRYFSVIKDYSCVREYELLPFHTLGFSKYEKLSLPNPLADTKPLSKERLQSLQLYMNQKREEI